MRTGVCFCLSVAWAETVPPMLFTYATAVRLSIFRRTCKSVRDFRKDFTARKAARSSTQFMWRLFSLTDHGPPVREPWDDAPQPVREASDSIERSGFPTTRLLLFQRSMLCTHHESSSLASFESGHGLLYACPPFSA